MVKINKHISELLHEKECVIVPDMGAFLNPLVKADNRLSQHLLTPPSKKIAFNVFLNHNDGFLANYIAQQEKMAYSTALKKIREFVDEFHREVNAGKKFVVEQVGILYKDGRGNIQFEPGIDTEHVKESFEISEFQNVPVLRKEIIPEKVKQIEKPNTSLHSETNPQEPAPIGRSKVGLIDKFLLAGSIFIFCMTVYNVFTYKMNFVQVKSNAHKTSANQPDDKRNPLSKSETPFRSMTTSPVIDLVDSSKAIVKKKPVKANPSMLAGDKEANKTVDNYFIIAGSFRSLENAKRKLNELKLKGFKNAKLISDSRSRVLVCYDHFNTLGEANKNLKTWKEQDKDVWIYRR